MASSPASLITPGSCRASGLRFANSRQDFRGYGMVDSQSEQTPAQQVEAASKAFEQEFERFARFTGFALDLNALTSLPMEEAVAEQRALSELRTRHLGKKSALAAAKKQIGRVAADVCAAFG